MDERKLLSALLKSRDVYETCRDEIDKSNWSPEAGTIYGLIEEYYKNDKDAVLCDSEILIARAQREINSNKIADLIVGAIKSLQSLDVSAVNVGKEVISLKQSVLGNKIASRLASGSVGMSQNSELIQWMDRFKELSEMGASSEAVSDEDIFSGVEAATLAGRFHGEGLIQLYPKVLNDQIDGGIRGGHHVLVFAPTEMGKTLFTINLCYGFLKQGLKILYIGNEDPAPDILMRMMSRLTGRTKYEILADPEGTDRVLASRRWDHFVFASLSPGTFPKIRKLVEKYKPQVLVLDQLRNLDVDTENRTQSLERAATEARNTAKRYNIPVISVTQAADSASGKTILHRGDVDGSNIGIPGQIDLMIGIGATDEMEERNLRTLSFPKNKVSGNHSPITVSIDPFTSRVIE